jgi:hypothetical protein
VWTHNEKTQNTLTKRVDLAVGGSEAVVLRPTLRRLNIDSHAFSVLHGVFNREVTGLDHVHQQDALGVALLPHFDVLQLGGMDHGSLGRDVAVFHHLGHCSQRLLIDLSLLLS